MRVYTLATSGFCLLYFPFRSISPCSRFLSPAPQEDRSTMIQGTIHNIFVKGGRLFHVCFALRKLGVADVCVLDVLLVYFTLLSPFQLIICYCVGRFRPTALDFHLTQLNTSLDELSVPACAYSVWRIVIVFTRVPSWKLLLSDQVKYRKALYYFKNIQGNDDKDFYVTLNDS